MERFSALGGISKNEFSHDAFLSLLPRVVPVPCATAFRLPAFGTLGPPIDNALTPMGQGEA